MSKRKPSREQRIRSELNRALELLRDQCSIGFDADMEYEFHLLLARELYGRAVDGFAGVSLWLHGFNDGAGI